MIVSPLERVPARNRIAVLVGLTLVVATAWVYLLLGAGIEMSKMDMGGEMMAMSPEWTPRYAALILIMWTVMMAAMMLPGAAPAIVWAASFATRPAEYGIRRALFFVAGYFVIWMGFSIAMTFLQWALDSQDQLSETMAIRSHMVTAMALIVVGTYQLTPLNLACLRDCRTSAKRITQDQHQSGWAITRRGMRYGVSCLGCCSVLMGLLFVGGLMNALWIALISLWIIAEKTLPWGNGIARFTGVGLVAWGCISLVAAGM